MRRASGCHAMIESSIDPGFRRALYEFIDRENRLLPEALMAESAIDAYLGKVIAHGECLLHIKGGVIIGALLGYCNAPDRSLAYVSLLLVSRDARHQGLGQSMMQSFAEVAQRRGFGRIQLEVSRNNRSAVRFYSNLGFHSLAERGKMTLMQSDLPLPTPASRKSSSAEEAERG